MKPEQENELFMKLGEIHERTKSIPKLTEDVSKLGGAVEVMSNKLDSTCKTVQEHDKDIATLKEADRNHTREIKRVANNDGLSRLRKVMIGGAILIGVSIIAVAIGKPELIISFLKLVGL